MHLCQKPEGIAWQKNSSCCTTQQLWYNSSHVLLTSLRLRKDQHNNFKGITSHLEGESIWVNEEANFNSPSLGSSRVTTLQHAARLISSCFTRKFCTSSDGKTSSGDGIFEQSLDWNRPGGHALSKEVVDLSHQAVGLMQQSSHNLSGSQEATFTQSLFKKSNACGCSFSTDWDTSMM